MGGNQMKLHDKYSLKASIYDRYSDDVLDFLTLYIEFGLNLFKIKGQRPPKHVEAMLAAKGIIYACDHYHFKFPSLAKISADFENLKTEYMLQCLQ